MIKNVYHKPPNKKVFRQHILASWDMLENIFYEEQQYFEKWRYMFGDWDKQPTLVLDLLITIFNL